MSLYLQRLLDRAAVVSAEAMVLRPLVTSGSPVVAFDQRLGDPGLAADFSLVGAPPEAPEPDAEPAEGGREAGEIETASRAAEPPSRRPRRRDAEPAPRVDEPQGEQPVPQSAKRRPAPRRSAPPATEVPLPPGEARKPAAPSAEPRPAPSSPPRPAPAQVRPSRQAPTEMHETRPSAATLPVAVPTPVAAEPILRAPRARPGSPELRPDVAAAPKRQSRAAEPAPAAEPMALAPTAEPAAPAPVAEPLARSPEPLPPPPRQLDRADVEKMIETALAGERRAAPAAPSTPAAAAAAADRPADKPAPRPGTAAEASVIGRLESSRFRPMLFGVRRR